MTYTRKGSLLRAENVCLDYKGQTVLRDVNLDVRDIVLPDRTQGQVAALIGRSGIGKTQLFRIMSGLNKPTSGKVFLGEAQQEVRVGQVGVVSQTYTLLRHRTVRSNLELALAQSGVGDRAQRKAEVESHAANFDLDKHLGKYPHELSGGQRQRASILQQIMTGNETVLMDEPFSGLDVLMIDKVLSLLTAVARLSELKTLVIVSHDIESALAISDTVHILAVPEPGRGATVVRSMDLAEMGLAYQPGIRDLPAFREAVREVKSAL